MVNLNADERIRVASGRMVFVLRSLGQDGSNTTRKSGIPQENGQRPFKGETDARRVR